jgi:hypothetical protein
VNSLTALSPGARECHGYLFRLQNKPSFIQNGQVLTEIYAKQSFCAYFSQFLAILDEPKALWNATGTKEQVPVAFLSLVHL